MWLYQCVESEIRSRWWDSHLAARSRILVELLSKFIIRLTGIANIDLLDFIVYVYVFVDLKLFSERKV